MSNRCFLAVLTAAGVTSWTPDGDININYVYAYPGANNCAISTDPQVAAADFYNASISTQLIIYLMGGGAEAVTIPLDYPVKKGESVFFATDGIAVVQLFYSPAEYIAT